MESQSNGLHVSPVNGKHCDLHRIARTPCADSSFQEGGLYCDKNGKISKPFPNKPYCYDGTGSVTCKNKSPKPVAFCQTVLPGNEAMLIPTDVENDAVLAVPDPSYWAGTAAQYVSSSVPWCVPS